MPVAYDPHPDPLIDPRRAYVPAGTPVFAVSVSFRDDDEGRGFAHRAAFLPAPCNRHPMILWSCTADDAAWQVTCIRAVQQSIIKQRCGGAPPCVVFAPSSSPSSPPRVP